MSDEKHVYDDALSDFESAKLFVLNCKSIEAKAIFEAMNPRCSCMRVQIEDGLATFYADLGNGTFVEWSFDWRYNESDDDDDVVVRENIAQWILGKIPTINGDAIRWRSHK